MNQIPTTTLALVLAGLFFVSQTGCRSRCNQSCGGGFFANNTTIAPTPTYGINIPSVARNQPYYAPNGGPISTTARAPSQRPAHPRLDQIQTFNGVNKEAALPTSVRNQQIQVPERGLLKATAVST